MQKTFLFFLFLAFTFTQLFAYTYDKQTLGPLYVEIEQPETLTLLDTQHNVRILLENKGQKPLNLSLNARGFNSVQFVADSVPNAMQLAAGEKRTIVAKITAKEGTYTAHYPLYLDVDAQIDGNSQKFTLIQPIETQLPLTKKQDSAVLDVPKHGAILLTQTSQYNVRVRQDKNPNDVIKLPRGWTGNDEESRASLSINPMERGGESKHSLNVHPPYRNSPGEIAVDYDLSLPKTKPISFSFDAAVRDTRPPETTDGVTFRVLVDGSKIGEFHTVSTRWEPHKFDLTPFAGKMITLTIITDPGPKRNTNCDSSYIGEPLIFAGEKANVISPAAKKALFVENLSAIRSGKSNSSKTTVAQLDGGLVAAVTNGNHGLLDGIIGFGDADSQIQYDGVNVWVDDLDWKMWNAKIDTSWKVAQNRGIQLSIGCGESTKITKIEFGPATQTAKRVYYGHGYCIDEPKAFRQTNGGHTFSTSHIGFDFDNGISLVMASTTPPDAIVVSPEKKIYTLSVCPATTFTLVPGKNGAMDCAVRYRPLFDKKAAPGVAAKSGKLVVDIWGNRYKDDADTIRLLAKYGLKDILYLVHVWQRYGYDNRLPDIWPPLERLGSLDDMKDAIKAADENGYLYALHDNYIDFYPDADGFSFDNLTFSKNGVPVKAWINEGINARSYQFRPDKIHPFLNRNLDMMLAEISPSSYFVDVFASIRLFDYYDESGNFHSRTETLKNWNESFDTIRERLSEKKYRSRNEISEGKQGKPATTGAYSSGEAAANAGFGICPTISEAGNDFLIGHLDGSDCQFMLLSAEPGEFRTHIPCKDWARVPFFDAVNHTTFSLHGVGYSSRYETGRGRMFHGIESDDYISCEILTGHAMMTDNSSRLRGTVRKYWLAQPFINAIKDAEIEKVEFVGGDIHRIKTLWSNGTFSFVNRGKSDWIFEDANVTLPQYGFFATFQNDDARIACGIIRDKDTNQVIDVSGFRSSDGKQTIYKNARAGESAAYGLMPISSSVSAFKDTGNGFELAIKWDVSGIIPRDYNTFVHISEPRKSRDQKIEEISVGGGFPTTPTSQWQGSVTHSYGTIRAPSDLPNGTYHLLVGLYDSKGDGHRASMFGQTDNRGRYIMGNLTVNRNGDNVSYKLEKIEPDPNEPFYERMMPAKPISHGSGYFTFLSKGGFRTEITANSATITPLPKEPPCEIQFMNNVSVKAFDAEGKFLQDIPLSPEKSFKTSRDVFQYRITK